jgi:hypothetical protein
MAIETEILELTSSDPVAISAQEVEDRKIKEVKEVKLSLCLNN